MGIGIGLGLADMPFSDGRAFWRWVDLCEAGGVDSLWQTDRLVSRDPILECMSMMAALAGGTRRLKFGMNVASVGLRDPLLLAKQCATIDFLSNGRLLPAFGIGNEKAPDWAAMGRPTQGRGQRTDEGLELIRRLWTEDSVSFEGKYYQYKDACISPKPLQKDFPLWIGGSSEAAIRRTARFGTGWLAGLESAEQVGPVVEAIKRACREAGREIDPEHFGAGFQVRFGRPDEPFLVKRFEAYRRRTGRDPGNQYVIGTAEQMLERLAIYVRGGVFKFILRPVGIDDEDMLRQTRRLIEDVLPHGPGLIKLAAAA
ncbi:MAG: LLM class flavin-dependent oxidoreductase [Alphaproteobacteria bacterium]|nr:LLM class flavin-dependent oxidoreductase [Alphaproteobacteria bacterium]